MGNVIIPSYPGTNLAPLKPLLALQEKAPTSHYIADALKERFKHYKTMEESVWREIYSAGQLTALFIEGKQLLMPNPYTGGWKVLKPSRDDESTKRAMNLMQFYADNCLTKWLNANPNIFIRPGSDTDSAELSARYADTVLNHYEEKFYTTEFNVQEGMSALIYGTYLNQFGYDPGLIGPEVLMDIFQTQHLQLGEGYGMCGDCGREGTATQYAQGCPQCGSPDVYREDPMGMEVQNVVGQQKQRMGDLFCRSRSLLSCRWDLKTRAEESPFLIHERKVPLTAIRTIMGNVQLPGGETQHVGLDMLQSLAYSGQAISGRGVGGQKKKAWEDEAVVSEMWMSVECYGDIELKGDEQTVSGQPIPEGRLADIFPEHMCVVGLNDMSVILGLYAEDHKKTFVSGTWHTKPNSGVGRGLQDTVEVQKRFNTLDSQALTYLQSTSTPAVLYNQDLLQSDEMQYLGTPNKNIPVDMRRFPEGARLSDAVWQFTPGSLPGQFMEYNHNFLNHMFQLTSLVTDFTGGLNPVVRNYTATGANISAALSNSLFTPMLMIKASVRKRAAQLLIPLYRDYFPMERYFSFTGKYGHMQGMSLKGADICHDLVFEVVAGSEQPVNTYSKREDLVNFFTVMGGAEGYIALKERYPEMMAGLERLWNIDAQSQSYDIVTSVCRYRLAQINTLFKQGVIQPQIMLQGVTPPISQFEPQQHAMATWWQDFLITDEGFQAPIPVRMAIEQLIQLHFANGGMQAQALGMQAGLAQASTMLAPGALQLLGQHAAPQAPTKGTEKVDPEQEALKQINYADAPPSVAQQMEKAAGLKPGKADSLRPPIIKAKAAMKTASRPMPKPAGARPKPKSPKR